MIDSLISLISMMIGTLCAGMFWQPSFDPNYARDCAQELRPSRRHEEQPMKPHKLPAQLSGLKHLSDVLEREHTSEAKQRLTERLESEMNEVLSTAEGLETWVRYALLAQRYVKPGETVPPQERGRLRTSGGRLPGLLQQRLGNRAWKYFVHAAEPRRAEYLIPLYDELVRLVGNEKGREALLSYTFRRR